MSRYIEQDYIGSAVSHLPTKIIQTEHGIDLFVPVTDAIEIIKNAPGINIVCCRECRRVREDGGHANCGGYLYCRKWKTLVDEDSYCSWGERE